MALTKIPPCKIFTKSNDDFIPKYQTIFSNFSKNSELIDNYEKYLVGVIVSIIKPITYPYFSGILSAECKCFKYKNEILTYSNLTTAREIFKSKIKTYDFEKIYIPEQFLMITNIQKCEV